MEESGASDEDEPLYKKYRFWNGLFILAIILNLVAIFASDLGLDAHVEGAYVEIENGWVSARVSSLPFIEKV